MKSIIYIISSMFILLTTLNAQTITFNEDSSEVGIENNRLYFPLINNGVLSDAPALETRHATYDDEGIIFFSGFFLSGYSDTTLFVNGVSADPGGNHYIPGSIGSEQEDPGNIIYVVKGIDTPFGKAWQNWKKAVEQGAYYYDGDNDGVYNPIDKNGNGQLDIDEDKPDILYDASLFSVYHDGKPGDDRAWDVDPLGIEIRQTVFVSTRNTILDDVVFIRYSILYKGLGNQLEPDTLSEVIFSIYSDCDIGMNTGFTDDLSGSDVLLNSGYTYNDSSDVDFGINPPTIFKTILQGPLVKSSNPNDRGYNKFGPDLGEEVFLGYKNSGLNFFMASHKGDVVVDMPPSDKSQARHYMLGLTRFGDQVDPCDWYYSEVSGDVDCSTINPLIWYSGDPVTDYGWINDSPVDQRDLTSTGKFTLRKNEPMDIIVAYTVGRGTDHLNSITVARETVEYIHEEYERNFSTIVGVEEKEIEEVPRTFALHQNYPNPFNPTTSIEYRVSSSEMVILTVYDVLGREVKTLVNEVKSPGSYCVKFDAANLSSGIYFYTLKSGSFVQSRKMILMK